MELWDIRTVLLGYDGSLASAKAARAAATIARHCNAQVIVLTAFPHVSRIVEHDDTVSADIARTTEMVEAMLNELLGAGVDAIGDVVEGPEAEALVNTAKSRNADLIVMGKGGHGIIHGLMPGSTTQYVTRHAPVPVLIVG